MSIRDELRQLMDVMIRDIITDEGFARELAEMAHTVAQEGRQNTAEALRTASRLHRAGRALR